MTDNGSDPLVETIQAVRERTRIRYLRGIHLLDQGRSLRAMTLLPGLFLSPLVAWSAVAVALVRRARSKTNKEA